MAPHMTSSLRFSTLGTLKLPTQFTFLMCGMISIILGILYAPLPFSFRLEKRLGRVFQLLPRRIAPFLMVFIVLIWAGAGRQIDVIGMLAQSLRLATPIGLGALAGILCERSGVINVAIEGMMLTAACTGFVAALYTQNIWLGLIIAVLSGGLTAALHAVLSIRFLVNQIISGMILNILAIGITGFIRKAFIVDSPLPAPPVFPAWQIPVLSDLPLIGQVFFRNQPMVYALLILVPTLHVLIFYTRWGLRTRAVGEHPQAADTLGVSVFKIRYINVIVGGFLAGLGGAWFSLETVGNFDDMMTEGKGFIALAAMIFGKWNPGGAFGGALLFGFADALQIKLQISGVQVPYQFLSMIPYLVTMIVLAGLIGRATPPAAEGVPFVKH
ncbi:MAG TPA: ABC transporter permease [Candidatus Limnocylindrales bacterium]|nr:ABC transporter permease [Candidatus Limnocylindrales bacterium]